MGHILAALMPENRLIMQVCIATGLRVSDVLELRTADLKRRQTVRQRKTGKARRVQWPAALYEQMEQGAGRLWVLRAGQTPDGTAHDRQCGKMSNGLRVSLSALGSCPDGRTSGRTRPEKWPLLKRTTKAVSLLHSGSCRTLTRW